MNVRAANGRVFYLDQNLVRTRLWSRNILNRELLSPAHYGSFHSYVVLSCVPVLFAGDYNLARVRPAIMPGRIILHHPPLVKMGSIWCESHYLLMPFENSAAVPEGAK